MLKGKHGETCVLLEHQKKSCWLSQPKFQNQIKNEDHDLERRDLLHSDIPEWLQEFRENLVDDGVPERRDSHASSSHEPSSEPAPTRSADLGKHIVYTHFPEDRNCEICQRTEITRVPCRRRNGEAVPRAENFGALMTADHKVLSEGCDDIQSWCRTWPPNGSSRIRAEQKLLRKHRDACKSSWSQIGNVKSLTLTIPWNLVKSVKIFRGIIVRRHHTDRKQMGLLREQCAEWNKVPLLYCCNQVWMKVCGQIPQNVIPICETFKISCLIGNSIRKAFWETIWRTYHSVWFIGWVLPCFCERPVKNPLIWKESLTCVVPWIRFVRGVNLEGWRTGCRPWGVGDDGRIGNLLEKTQCKGGDISPRKWKIYFSSRRWTNQTPWRRFGPENIHLDMAASHSRRSHEDFLGESEGSLPPPQDSFPDAGEAINDFWSMSGNFMYRHHVEPRVRLLLAERRIIPYSTEMHWRIQNYKNKFWCLTRTPHRRR